ncbi:MAG: hypothetical protein HY282_17445 [Nitrospirae bacterium]|nr:hypothetical protein [Candidatus Manganitrophaceae bacterium]
MMLSSAGGSGNLPPKISQIEITPPTPDLQSVLTVQLQSEDPNHDRVTYRYQWFVNDKEVGDQPVLPLAGFRQGDLVSVKVVPSDGKSQGDLVQSSPVRIGNNLPVIKAIKLVPEVLKAGQGVHAEVDGFDKEGDVVRYTYQWYINDQPIDGNNQADLDGANVHSADRIAVKVTPSDSSSEGVPQTSRISVVINQAPEITSFPPTEVVEGQYRYQIIANDSDGDPLNYHLIEAPAGMILNPTSGLLEWSVKELPEKKVSVKIQVDDAKGGKSIQQFVIQAG